MALETLTIASVETATTRGGANTGSQYRIVNTSDGRKLFCFDSKLFPIIDHAHTIGGDVQPSKDGKSLRLVGAAEQVGSNGHAATTATPNDVRDMNICRQVALKAAVDAFQKRDHAGNMEEYAAVICTLADTFVKWLEPASDDGADPWGKEPF